MPIKLPTPDEIASGSPFGGRKTLANNTPVGRNKPSLSSTLKTPPPDYQPQQNQGSLLGDIGRGAAVGTLQLGGAIGDLPNLLTGGAVPALSPSLRDPIESLREGYRPETTQAMQNIQQAEGFGGTLGGIGEVARFKQPRQPEKPEGERVRAASAADQQQTGSTPPSAESSSAPTQSPASQSTPQPQPSVPVEQLRAALLHSPKSRQSPGDQSSTDSRALVESQSAEVAKLYADQPARAGRIEAVLTSLDDAAKEGEVLPFPRANAKRLNQIFDALDGLILRPPDRDLEGKALAAYYLEQAAGPLGGIFINAFRAGSLMSEGHIYRGWEATLPKAVKDVMKAYRYSDEGVQTLRGDPVVGREDLSAAELFMQASGLAPHQVIERYEQNRLLKNLERKIINRRRSLINAYYMAWRDGDRDEMRTIRKKMAGFNKAYPQTAITSKTITQSFRNRQRYTKEARDGMVFNKSLRPLLQEQRFAA